jgi:hypothetical protein
LNPSAENIVTSIPLPTSSFGFSISLLLFFGGGASVFLAGVVALFPGVLCRVKLAFPRGIAEAGLLPLGSVATPCCDVDGLLGVIPRLFALARGAIEFAVDVVGSLGG